jgi:hypothetical protein
MRLKLANRFVRRDTFRLKLESLVGGEELKRQVWIMKRKNN